MFGSLGVPELIFIFALALLIFGPRKLPEIGRTIGRGLAEFRKASTDLKRSLNTEMVEEEMRRSDPRKIIGDDAPVSHSKAKGAGTGDRPSPAGTGDKPSSEDAGDPRQGDDPRQGPPRGDDAPEGSVARSQSGGNQSGGNQSGGAPAGETSTNPEAS